MMANTFLFFSLEFLSNKKLLSLSRVLLYSVPPIILTGIIVFSNTIINQVFLMGDTRIVTFGYIYYFYSLIMFIYFALCYKNFYLTYKTFKNATDKRVERIQLYYVFVGTSLSVIIGLICDIVLPFFGYFTFYWFGPIMTIIFVGFTVFAIIKHHLFNAKVIATEIFVLSLWGFVLMRTLFSETLQDQLLNGGLLVTTIFFGVLLIRGVLKEVSQREKIEALAKDLEKANKNLAKVNTDLAKANDRLKELDNLKNEFLSFATHQIRSPLTAIKGYASLLLEGDFGEMIDPVKNAVHTIFQSCQNLVIIVNEFLDISRIEQGRMKYDMIDFDVKKLCEDTLNELKPNIEKQGLTSSFSAEDKNFMWNGDQGKIKQVIGNLIDNSIKYTPHGGISIKVSIKDKNILIAISDTGIGINKEDIPKLFEKFSRTKEANKQNVIGTGLGLYVAKQMIEAHKGRVWVESKGSGLGSTFYIELPLKK